jgi:long-chain acyl-CoA synthetase
MEYHNTEPLRNVGDLPTMLAARYGNRRAVTGPERTQSFAALEARANSVAAVLSNAGVAPGDRVGMYLPNTLQFPESYFGIIKAGGVPVALNLRLDPGSLEYVLSDSGADVLIADDTVGTDATAPTPEALADRAAVDLTIRPGGDATGGLDYDRAVEAAPDTFATVERGFDDVCLQLYTSGTTGNPKGVHSTHRNLLATNESFVRSPLPLDPDEAALCVLPLFHIFGLQVVLTPVLYAGGSVVLRQDPVPDRLLATIDDHDLTLMFGVPALYNMMSRAYRQDPDAYDLSSLRYAMCAAAPLAADTRRSVERGWNVRMFEGWGMTETSPAGALAPPMGVRKGAGCVGPPMPGVRIKLVDPDTRADRVAHEDLVPFPDGSLPFDDEAAVTGEIAVKGPNVFEGYHNRPEINERVFDDDGWFYTGDIARVDADGFLWMIDRVDDVIAVGGEDVYPATVEDALYDHPAVAEAAVVAAPHEIKGEAPVAYVVAESDADVTEPELREFALDRVATYAHPRRVFFVEALPRGGTRKVKRYKLEERAEHDTGGGVSSGDEL